MKRFRTWREVRRRERDVRRIRAAKLRLENLLETTPRYWRAAVIGGSSSFELGHITKEQAVNHSGLEGQSIAYIDLENAFIALKGDPVPHTAESLGINT